MYNELYDVIYRLFYGDSIDLTSFQLFVPEFLTYICCAVVIFIPIAFVYYLFKWICRMLEW